MESECEEESGSRDLRLACPVLVSERLVLRRPVADDLEDLHRLANDRRVAMMLGRMPHPYSIADASRFIETGQQGDGCTYAVTQAGSGVFMGCGGLMPRGGSIEIGYWIGEPHWGNGFATETAQLLVDLAFRATAFGEIAAWCRVINPASRRVLEKCGFRYAGTGMRETLAAGTVAMERFRLDRKTWLALRSWASRA